MCFILSIEISEQLDFCLFVNTFMSVLWMGSMEIVLGVTDVQKIAHVYAINFEIIWPSVFGLWLQHFGFY